MVFLVAVWCVSGASTSAECVRFEPSQLNWPSNEVVFDGTVLELHEKETEWNQVAVLQVHRVFKGQLPARIEVHHTASLEVPQLEAGQRYVLPIRRSYPSGTGPIPRRPALAPEDDPSLVWATANCGGALRDRLEGDGWLNGFGRGWPPGAR